MRKYLNSLFALLMLSLIFPASTRAEHDHSHHSALQSSTPSSTSIYNIDSIWTDQNGAEFALSSLSGQPVVLAMIYTSCEYACPLIVDMVKRVEKSLSDSERDKVNFLLVTFDTEHDTPSQLKAYAVKRGLTLEHWKLIRGSADDTLELGVLLGVNFRKNEDGGFSHSNTVTLLNSRGEIAAQSISLQSDINKVIETLALELKGPTAAK